MPDPAQTPASRRFLPPSGSSRRQHAASATRQSQSSQYVQPSSSSPFLHTPFPKRTQYMDDIETSFDNGQTATPLTTQASSKSSRIRPSRAEFIEDDLYDNDLQAPDPKDSMSIGRWSHDDFVQVVNHYETEAHLPKINLSSPLPKRQKLSHFEDVSHEIKDISSSPVMRQMDFAEPKSPERFRIDGHDGYNLDIQDTNDTENLEETQSVRTKFRPGSKIDDGLAGRHARQTARTAFKATSSGAMPWSEAPLPSTFSPSKRRGKHDYVYRGAAETVRSWVLEIAAEQGKTTERPGSSFDAHKVTTDCSGRFELVDDEEGNTWMLVNQENNSELQNSVGHTDQETMRSVMIKGVHTSWKIEDVKSIRPTDSSKELNVAVLWKYNHLDKTSEVTAP